MTTKPSSVGLDRGIYSSPFDAFTNYMNILGDFINRVNSLYPPEIDNDQLNSLLTSIKNEGDEIEMKDKEIARLQAKIEKLEAANEKLREKEEKPKAKPARAPRKTASKKETAKKETENTAEAKAPAKEEKK
jgi:alpha-amylase